MPFDSLGKWWPDYTLQAPTPEPPAAFYPIRHCHHCRALTDREVCARCQATQLSPVFYQIRAEVRAGLRSDWPVLSHTQMQCDHTKRVTTLSALRAFRGIVVRAVMYGFGFGSAPHGPLHLYHGDEFSRDELDGNEGAAA